jgi:predicted ATPase/DNA-binding winged helix-turn-helix (wHTH) protein
VRIDGVAVKLGARAFDVLVALIERRDRVVGKHELLDLVWPGLVVEENNLQVHISALRKLLGPQIIATVPGRGYRFTCSLGSDDGESRAMAVDAAAAPPATVGNLPQHQPPLHGRADDLRDLALLVEAHPLVTLVGPAGVGKTTLALAVAFARRGRLVDGEWLVELAPVDDVTGLPQAVARALRITLHGQGTALEQLVGALQTRTLLLVLDNCEHLLAAVGPLVQAVAAYAPGVRVLATSQERLDVPDERLFHVQPLTLPIADDADSIAQSAAIALFTERARAVDPRFALDPSNAQAVFDICRQLDGLPLAIELAAARVRLLGVQGLRDRLGERFRVLTGGARTAMPRHQTLHAALDWSHALLSADEQAVLRRLAVFVGGFTLELAQQVASDERIDAWAVLDELSALVDKSLLMADAAEPPRYRLLETTRAYALEKLAGAGEARAVSARHAQAIRELFVRSEEARYGEQGSLSMDAFVTRLAPELDNLRAALRWAMDAGGDLAVAIALAGASAEVFRTLGLTQEALSTMLALRGQVGDLAPPESAFVFWHRLALLGSHGRLPQALVLDAHARAEQSCRLIRSPRRLYQCLCGTAWAMSSAFDSAREARLLEEIAALEQPAWPAWLRGQRLALLSAICNRHGRFATALEFLNQQQTLLEQEPGEEALLLNCLANQCFKLICLERYDETVAMAQALVTCRNNHPHICVGLGLAHLTLALACLGRLAEAERTMRQAMPGWRRDGTLPWVYVALTPLLAAQGRLADAMRVFGAAIAFFDRMGMDQPQIVNRIRHRLQQELDTQVAKTADIGRWQREGARLEEDALVALCLAPATATARPYPPALPLVRRIGQRAGT